MSYEKVLQAKNCIVGTKQTVKALNKGLVSEVLIAKDADPSITANVLDTANNLDVKITYVESKTKLGKLCGIGVGAAAVALTN